MSQAERGTRAGSIAQEKPLMDDSQARGLVAAVLLHCHFSLIIESGIQTMSAFVQGRHWSR